MVDRRLLLAGAGALAVLAGVRWLNGGDVEAAGSFEIQKSDSEWRRILTKPQYEVLRLHRTETPGLEPAQSRKAQRHLCLRRLRAAAVLLGDEIRQQDRLAELLSRRCRTRIGTSTDHVLLRAAHRGALPPLRRTSRPCLRRRAAADGPALLHQRRRADIPPRRAGLIISLFLLASAISAAASAVLRRGGAACGPGRSRK